MRLSLPSLLSLAAFALLASCSQTTSPLQPDSTGGSALSLKITFTKASAAPGRAPATDFVTGAVTLKKGAVTRVEPVLVAGSHASAAISSLEAGVWAVTLEFMNTSGIITHTGSTTATLQNGQTLALSLTVNAVTGSLSLDSDLPIDVFPPTLWNRMESEISEVGLPLLVIGTPSYMPGLFGNGLSPTPVGDLTIPAAAFDLDKGALEFWYTPNWSTPNSYYHEILRSEGSYDDIRLVYYDLTRVYISAWNGYCPGPAANMPMRAGQPNHFALVWNRLGINGSADIARLYFNGTLVMSNSQPIISYAPKNVRFMEFSYTNPEASAYGGVIDNLKIYNYSKTDFSDRSLE